ncbi:MAG: type II toxin-antitoxin system HicA family toxin [bacterium]
MSKWWKLPYEKPLRQTTCGKQLARLLEQRGWKLKRIAGSHHRYEHPD